MKRLLGVLGVWVLALTLLPSSALAAARVYVRVGPPKAIVEVRTAAPGPGHVWVTGYHRWDGGAYVWVPGRWAVPPRHSRAWVPGHWAHHSHSGWYWVEGHWRH